MRPFRNFKTFCIVLALFSGSIAHSQSDNLQNKIKELTEALAKQPEHHFFVGLWSKANRFDQQRLSAALRAKEDGVLIQGVTEVQSELSTRLQKDKDQFLTWISKQGLSQEILVETLPVDGSFILFKTDVDGISRILQAAAKHELPSVFLDHLAY